MKCPYTVDTKEIEQYCFEYNAEGNVVIQTKVNKINRTCVDCLQAECGAFYDGRCHYKQD